MDMLVTKPAIAKGLFFPPVDQYPGKHRHTAAAASVAHFRNMLDARFCHASTLANTVTALKDLVSECNVDCDASGMSLQAMDSSHVSLCSLHMASKGFEHYECQQSISLGINLVSLGKVLKCMGTDGSLSLQSQPNGDRLSLMCKSGDRESHFELNLMDIENDRLGIPDVQYTSTVTLPSSEFQRICRDLSVLGDTCVVVCRSDSLTFRVDNGDIGRGSITILPGSGTCASADDMSVSIDVTTPLDMMFSLKYLNMFAKSTPLAPTVTLSMTENMPIRVHYPIDGLGHLRFYLAPKINDDS